MLPITSEDLIEGLEHVKSYYSRIVVAYHDSCISGVRRCLLPKELPHPQQVARNQQKRLVRDFKAGLGTFASAQAHDLFVATPGWQNFK